MYLCKSILEHVIMKRLWLFACSLFLSVILYAQDQVLLPDSVQSIIGKLLAEKNQDVKTNMNLEFYTSGGAYFSEGALDEAGFKVNRVRWEIHGSFHDKFSYHFRQSFNKVSNPHSVDNLSNSVEYAYVKWQMQPAVGLTVGKQLFRLGGYEYWVNGIKVREFSDFNNNINCYHAGVALNLTPSENHTFNIQIMNNRNGSDADTYIYGLPSTLKSAKIPLMSVLNWNGYFADKKLFFCYGLASGEQAQHKGMVYLTAGNVYQNGPLTAYLDVMYTRQGLDNMGIVSELQRYRTNPNTLQNVEYLSFIGDVDYRIHDHWNLYLKGAYETAGIFKVEDADALPKGSYYRSWNAQCCVEYFPMKDKELQLFAHFLYKGYSLTDKGKALGASYKDTQRISLGLVYIIPVL